MPDKIIKLPDRLKAITDFIKQDAAVADIGTDHGFLPVYLAQSGLARRIYASDISAGSLEAARRSAEKYGVTHLISFIVAPGLEGINEGDADTVVIAGMGGETIADVLSGAPWTRHDRISLILQPQSKQGELCRRLRENGYVLRDARLTYDNGRFYVIMFYKGGKSDSKLEPELEFLARLMYRKDPLFTDYLDDLIIKTRKALDNMKNSQAPELLDMALRLSVYISIKEANKEWLA